MEFDGAGGFLARYAHGDRTDQPLAMSRGGQDYYIQADHQGSVIRVTDSAGAVVNSYAYDAYGQRLAATEGVEIAYGYTGREYDAESGLMYYRARVYDPAMGRFLQTDPLGFGAGDLNLYRYLINNPLNFNDPTGENPKIGAAIGNALIGCYAAANLSTGAFVTGFASGFDQVLQQRGGDQCKKIKKLSDKELKQLTDKIVTKLAKHTLSGCLSGLTFLAGNRELSIAFFVTPIATMALFAGRDAGREFAEGLLEDTNAGEDGCCEED